MLAMRRSGRAASSWSVQRICSIARFLLFIPPVVILLQFCDACSKPNPYQYFEAFVLPVIGLIAALVGLLLRNQWRECFVVLGAIVGIILIASGYMLGIKPCPMCLTFWLLWAVLLFEVVVGNGTLSKMGSLAILTATCSVIMISMSPYVRASARSFAAQNFVSAEGLRVGASMPVTGIFDPNGVIIFAARCPTCWSGKMSEILRILQKRHPAKKLLVVVLKDVEQPTWAKGVIVKSVDSATFESFNIRTHGVPYIMVFDSGKVSESFDATGVGKAK